MTCGKDPRRFGVVGVPTAPTNPDAQRQRHRLAHELRSLYNPDHRAVALDMATLRRILDALET